MTIVSLLDAETRAAWMEYLASTSDAPADRYCEVEPWAWAKLTMKLQAIHVRRESVTGVAA